MQEADMNYVEDFLVRHGSVAMLGVFRDMRKELAEALKPSHNKQSTPLGEPVLEPQIWGSRGFFGYKRVS